MVDTGELSDRAVAERAGIGWSAKNCSIITPEFGSYVYLGEMITSIPFSPSEQMVLIASIWYIISNTVYDVTK